MRGSSREGSPRAAQAPGRGPRTRWSIALLLLLATVGLAFASWGLVRLNTWYLASDQFAFLTQAVDLQDGRLFHEDASLRLMQPDALPGAAYDALYQTYYWRDGQLYSRYPPGFPALLALAGLLGGEIAQHALNPILYLLFLVVLGMLSATLLESRDRAMAVGAGVVAIWLLLLLPTRLHYWGLTVARDLPAHLLGLLAVLAAVRRLPIWSGLALGLACCIRPDALLYGLSIAAIFLLQRVPTRNWLAAGVTFAVSVLPLLLYNLAVEGNPLVFTQGAEFGALLSALPERGGVVPVVATVAPSGGAFRFSHLARSLPGNARYLFSAFGWFTIPILIALVWSLRRNRVLVAAILPYALVGLLFYSFWSHPDPRYLAGVVTCLIVLAAVGVVLAFRAVVVTGGWGVRLAVLILGGAALVATLGGAPSWLPPPQRVAWTLLATLVALSFAVMLAPLRARLTVAWPVLPALALALLGLGLVVSSEGRRDPFQYAELLRARAAVAKSIPPGSLVVTSAALGRPAENLRFYSGVEAFYAEEIPLLQVNPDQATVRFVLAGRRVFYLLEARDRTTLQRLARHGEVRVVERRSGPGVLEWYVDPRRVPSGAVLYEVRLSADQERQIREYLGKPAGALEEWKGPRES